MLKFLAKLRFSATCVLVAVVALDLLVIGLVGLTVKKELAKVNVVHVDGLDCLARTTKAFSGIFIAVVCRKDPQ